MKLEERIEAFAELKRKIDGLSDQDLDKISQGASIHNKWFTKESVTQAFEGISYMLEHEKLIEWTNRYKLDIEVPKIVGIVMAGNIPMVGFHDLLCILLSGHYAAIKPSSDDTFLIKQVVDWIIEIEPRFNKNIELREKLTNIDAVIATGSDNSARYFDYYFKDIPSIIRKNRTSISIINGEETEQELKNLGQDIFSYFGLGCRNVSKVFTPKGYDLTSIFPLWEEHSEVINHHKYRNNYDYHKSIYLVNKTPHLDTGYLLVVSSDELVSPLSVLYHQEYESRESLEEVLAEHSEKIQCKVSKDDIPFGQTQIPEVWDYADNVDVLAFLSTIK